MISHFDYKLIVFANNDVMDIQCTSLITHINDYIPASRFDIARDKHEFPDIAYKPRDSSNTRQIIIIANNHISDFI
jgi:hypothetical protein